MGLCQSKFTEHNEFISVPSFDCIFLIFPILKFCVSTSVYFSMFFIFTNSCQPIECQCQTADLSTLLENRAL